MAERTDSDISRGFVLPPSTLVTSATPPQKQSTGSGVEVVEVVGAKKDEVAIVVGSRKNSVTKAVR